MLELEILHKFMILHAIYHKYIYLNIKVHMHLACFPIYIHHDNPHVIEVIF